LRVADKGYSRNVPYPLKLISMFLFQNWYGRTCVYYKILRTVSSVMNSF